MAKRKPLEIWKPIEGYSNYLISSFGRVLGPKGKILKPSIRKGYQRVNLFKDKGYKTFSVHLLVLNAFVGKCPSGHEAFHEDNDPSNPALSNLKWARHSKNIQYAYDCGRKVTSGCFGKKGEGHVGAKLSAIGVQRIRRLHKKGKKQKDLAELFNVAASLIHHIVNRKLWKHI